jgi:SHS2 domain-containing protein
MHTERTRAAGHELVDHTSEITMRLHAPTLPALMTEATEAFAELVPSRLRGVDAGTWRDFRVEDSDAAAGLVEWLNETVYLCEVEQWLPVEAHFTHVNGGGFRVRARGVRLDAPFVGVKAATLHGAAVRGDETGFEAEVTLDV